MRYFTVLLFIGLGLAYAQSVQSPDQFFGRPLGSEFTRHYEVVSYFKQLEKNAGERLKLVQYGTTHENRELLVAFISTPENLANLEKIRSSHELMNSEEKTAIVWLSYNVHGNESAGTEAALQTAFELITKHQDLLKNTVVILDPCVNPDGRDRYVNWYYQQKGNFPDNAVATAEHNEEWPSGRPNHYLFDLNRDWMWNTQKETQQRIAVYNKWMPHVHVDFHEQGMNAPYYFAPAAEPYHHVITNWQREFQNGTGKNHAKYFDKNGWFYFTREIFDLLYPSYGDTYPTYCGAVGMTYEQGGSGHGGLAVINDDGDTLTLTERLLHHHTTGISTVEYASEQASALISNYQAFMKQDKRTYKSFAFTGNEDQRTALLKLLDAHQIHYYQGTNSAAKGFVYSKSSEGSLQVTEQFIVVHTDQPKGAMIEVLFEPKTSLADSLTYDITAWNLPYAYGLEAIASKTKIPSRNLNLTIPKLNQTVPGAYAYLLNWNGMNDARFLAGVLKAGLKVRYSENPFEMEGKSYGRGTLIIARADNSAGFEEKLMNMANETGVLLTATMTGMVEKGNDLGSSSVKMIHDTRIGMIYDESASSLSVGEVWHFFDNELHYPVQKIKLESVDGNVLNTLDVLIVPEMWSSLDPSGEAVLAWIERGGKLITIGSAAKLVEGKEGFKLKSREDGETKKEDPTAFGSKHEHTHVSYSQAERSMISNTITGAIFKCSLDTSHPLCFGYPDTYYTLKMSADAYDCIGETGNAAVLENSPKPLNGFAGSMALSRQSNSLIVGMENYGAGAVVYLMDNPLFRGFWENGKLFMANAIFFANN
ncbi:MAG: hypothetical protein RIT43_1779 [Bacteroidota bacterium]